MKSAVATAGATGRTGVRESQANENSPKPGKGDLPIARACHSSWSNRPNSPKRKKEKKNSRLSGTATSKWRCVGREPVEVVTPMVISHDNRRPSFCLGVTRRLRENWLTAAMQFWKPENLLQAGFSSIRRLESLYRLFSSILSDQIDEECVLVLFLI